MKYLMKYLDASRSVMMKEIIDSEGDVEYTLRQSCGKAARRHEQLKRRLSEKIPGVTPSRFLFEISGREGTVYSMAVEEKIVAEIHVCTPVGIPIGGKNRRAVPDM